MSKQATRSKWMSEKKLAEAVAKLPKVEWLKRNYAIAGTKRLWDFAYCAQGKTVLVEFDGPEHYTKVSQMRIDDSKDLFSAQKGFRTVRFPYWLVLDADTAKHYFNLDSDCEPDFEHGFPTIPHLPANFCAPGVTRFEKELNQLPPKVKAQVIATLKRRAEKEGAKYVVPQSGQTWRLLRSGWGSRVESATENVVTALVRVVFAKVSISRAVAACDFIISKPQSTWEPLYCPLVTAIFVLYARPFGRNEGVGALPKNFSDYDSEEKKTLHQMLIQGRNKLFAHLDAGCEYYDAENDPVAPLVRVSLNVTTVSDGVLDVHPQVYGPELLLKSVPKIKVLCQDLMRKLQAEEANLVQRLGESGFQFKVGENILDFPPTRRIL